MHMKNSNAFSTFNKTLIATLLTFNAGSAFGFGIEAKGVLKTYGQPVHETLTKRAALESGFLTESQTVELKHLIEGSRFNDDPEGCLLEGKHRKSAVICFASEFIGPGKSKADTDPTKSAHFGDFQFLHAMGKPAASRSEIKGRILLFAAHAWRIATDNDSFTKFTHDYDVVIQHLQLNTPIEKLSESQKIVRNSARLFPKEVLFFHAINQVQFQYRAMGSLLHLVQDSYSKGHVVRVGWEQGHNSGKIRYFQDYKQQDSNEHKHLDNHDAGEVNEHSVLEIHGTGIALDRSKQILSMAAAKCPWTRGPVSSAGGCSQSLYGLLANDIFDFESSDESIDTRSHIDLVPKPNVPDPNYLGGS